MCVIYHKLRAINVNASVVTLDEVAKHPIVYCGDFGTYRFLLRAFERYGLIPNFVLQTDDPARSAVEVNRCAAVAIVPYNAYYNLMQMCPELPVRAAKLVDGNLRRSIYIRKTAGYPTGERADAFYQALRGEMLSHWKTVQNYMERYFAGMGDIPPEN